MAKADAPPARVNHLGLIASGVSVSRLTCSADGKSLAGS